MLLPNRPTVCPTDYILRSHRGSTAERDREWKPERDFAAWAHRKRRSNGRAGYSLICRYLTPTNPHRSFIDN
jgi:hypothetical protein